MEIKVVDVNGRGGVITTAKTSSIGKAIMETSRWMRKRNKIVGAVGYDSCDHFMIEDAETSRKIAEVIFV